MNDRSIESDGDDIVTSGLLSAATQAPLTSFGNAAIGNHEFKEVKLAFTVLYLRLLPKGAVDLPHQDIAAHIQNELAKSDNPAVRERV